MWRTTFDDRVPVINFILRMRRRVSEEFEKGGSVEKHDIRILLSYLFHHATIPFRRFQDGPEPMEIDSILPFVHTFHQDVRCSDWVIVNQVQIGSEDGHSFVNGEKGAFLWNDAMWTESRISVQPLLVKSRSFSVDDKSGDTQSPSFVVTFTMPFPCPNSGG